MREEEKEEKFTNMTKAVINEHSGLIPMIMTAEAHNVLMLDFTPSKEELNKKLHIIVIYMSLHKN